MRKYLTLSLLLLLAGCQSQNRFSLYGSEIVVYDGDWDTLSNCCHAAMSLLLDDINEEKGLDEYPPVDGAGRVWSQDDQRTARRATLSCSVDEQNYRIDISQIENKPAIVVIDSPSDDSRLINHLLKLFSNFDVKSVDSI